ncbi:MAG: DUF4442 domain-containing protein [Bacteroidetes bacterium]|nr:DUF4442 domain-containing protein [Bacteroidota bacterium]
MELFKTERKESGGTTLLRWAYNFWPCIFCSGGRVTFIAADFKEVHVRLSLNLRTVNRVGTIFGGSIYSSIDPHFMLMFMRILGKDYVVWDKAAHIRFLRPATEKMKCRFLIQDEMIDEIRQQVAMKGEYVFDLPLKFEDESGKVYAAINKTLYVASKEFYQKKIEAKQNKN